MSDAKRASRAHNIHDLEAMARRHLPRGLFDFITRGAEDEVTMRENLASIKRIALRQRVGVDVSKRDISISLFGEKQSMPIVMGITGLTGIIAWRGEELLAQGGCDAGIPFTIGSTNFTALERIQAICGERTWCQIYPTRRRENSNYQFEQALRLGVKTLVLTLDSAVGPNREYLKKSGFGVPIKPTPGAIVDTLLHPRWLFGTYLRYHLSGLPRLANMPDGHGNLFDRKADFSSMPIADDITWQEIGEMRRRWPGNFVVKGISTAEDARLAAQQGVDGVIVSNHGGRSLDGCVASMTALPEVVDAVGDRLTVMVDGGFLRGADVLKALAMGAKAVMIGRSSLFGLAAAGKPGVDRALAIYREEIDRSLGLVGCRSVAELNRSHLLMPGGA